MSQDRQLTTEQSANTITTQQSLSILRNLICETQKEARPPRTIALPRRTKKTISQIQPTKASEHEQISQELELAQEERQNKLAFTKRSIIALTILGGSGYTFKTMQRTPATRFISDALTASSLAWNACQGVAGCMALGFAYYQIHKLIYSGCVTEKEFTILQKACKKDSEKITALRDSVATQAIAINDHAAELDKTQTAISSIAASQADLVRVTTAHAKDLDEARKCTQRIAAALVAQEQAINNHATLMKKQYNFCEPAMIKTEPIIIPGRIEEHAATPQLPIYQPANFQIPKATTVSQEEPESGCCFFSCCGKKSISVKKPR